MKMVRTLFGAAAIATLTFAPSPIQSSAQAADKYAAYLIDVKSGKVLFSRNGKSLRYPASLTKMMTLYMVFEKLQSGKLKLDSKLKVSKYAASRPPSRLGLRAGSTIRVRDAIYALVTKSANDVATTVAENLGGSESKFAAMMTRKARSIGMSRTTFKNASGLPNKQQKTTAADMALLGRALQDRFPKYYKFFNTRSYKYGKRRYNNHNKLLGRVKGVDGIKTGYIRASGFNLVTNIKSRDRHVVAVVMGGKTGRSRDAHMKKLLSKYLTKAKTGKRRTALVVPRSSGKKKSRSYIKLASKIPLPRAKTGAVQVAKAPMPAPAPVALEAKPVAIAMASNTLATLPRARANREKAKLAARIDLTPTAAIATPKPKLSTARLALPPLPRPANDPIGDISTHNKTVAVVNSTKAKPAGWQIQLGAAPSQKAANAILAKARTSNNRLLAKVANYTETVTKNNTTLYRARFAGFANKAAARNACAVLKKKKFACLALNP